MSSLKRHSSIGITFTYYKTGTYNEKSKWYLRHSHKTGRKIGFLFFEWLRVK